MKRTCPECFAPYEPKGAWQKSCTPCWAKAKERKIKADAYMDGYREGCATANAVLNSLRNRQPDAAQLDPKLIRRIVELTHPDRHPPERFAQANGLTAELLGMVRK